MNVCLYKLALSGSCTFSDAILRLNSPRVRRKEGIVMLYPLGVRHRAKKPPSQPDVSGASGRNITTTDGNGALFSLPPNLSLPRRNRTSAAFNT